MKRSITRWTMAVTAAGVLSLPVSSFARTTQDPQPQPQQQQPPAQPQPEQQRNAAAATAGATDADAAAARADTAAISVGNTGSRR